MAKKTSIAKISEEAVIDRLAGLIFEIYLNQLKQTHDQKDLL